LADSSLEPSTSATVVSLLEDALRCPSDRLRKGQVRVFSTPLSQLYLAKHTMHNKELLSCFFSRELRSYTRNRCIY
jgi:hypothetical protein